MRVGCRWIVLVSLMVCACVPSIPPLPSEGGPAWLELKTEHFTLWTDASAMRGRALIREMERRREIILAAMRGDAANNSIADKTHLVAIVLRDWLEAGEYGANRPWSAGVVIGQPGFLICADKLRSFALNHELAHVLSFALVPRQPLWLAEAIASYFEEFDFTPDGASAEIGIAPRSVRGYLASRYPAPVADVLGCVENRCRDAAFDATSWAMFAYLANHHPQAVDRYMARFAELSRDVDAPAWYEDRFDTTPRTARALKDSRERERGWIAQAWRDAFPELPPDKLDGKLRDWVRENKLHVFPIAARTTRVAITERTLGEADVLAIRGWMGLAFTDDMQSGRANIEAALSHDRTNVLARLVHAAMTHAITLDDARATVAAHPDDWRALRLVEFALHGTREGDQAAAQICAMSSNTASECRGPRRAPAVSGD